MPFSFFDRPSVADIAYRCMCLRVELVRFLMECELRANFTQENWQEEQSKLSNLKVWVERENLYQHMSHLEQVRFGKPLCTWDHNDLLNCSGIHETFGAMVWGGYAGGLYCEEMLTFEKPHRRDDPAKEIPALLQASDWVNNLGQRTYYTLAYERDTTLAYYLRFAYLKQFRRKVLTESAYVELVTDLVYRIKDREIRGILIDQNDLCFKGRRFDETSDQECAFYAHVLSSRLLALTWLLGERRNWDQPLDRFLANFPDWLPILFE